MSYGMESTEISSRYFSNPAGEMTMRILPGARAGVAEGVNRTAVAVCTFAFSEFVPLPFRKDFVFAFEDVEGLIFVLVGVGWGAAAGW